MIEVKHLVKKFGDNTVLKDVNAVVNDGEVICIIGPSGTGKSTLLRCLNLLEQPTDGEILIDGQNILDPKCNINQIRKSMGMVFQSFNLFSHMTVLQNCMVGPVKLNHETKEDAQKHAQELLEMVGLGEKLNAWPDELSGGQKQRVAIARCLAMRPKTILFDEPTSALDPTMVSEVLAVIRRLAKEGLTVIIVTHEMDFARDVSTRIFYMDQGIVYEEGPPQQIFENPQKELTRAFIHRIRSFTFSIAGRVFDFYKMIGDIENFCFKHGLSATQANHIQLVNEELLMGKLMQRSDLLFPIEITLEYSEKDGNITYTIAYPGDNFNPFESKLDIEEEMDLSLMILENITQECNHNYQDEMNIIQLTL